VVDTESAIFPGEVKTEEKSGEKSFLIKKADIVALGESELLPGVWRRKRKSITIWGKKKGHICLGATQGSEKQKEGVARSFRSSPKAKRGKGRGFVPVKFLGR